MGAPAIFASIIASWNLTIFTPGEVKNVEDICFCCDECKWFVATGLASAANGAKNVHGFTSR